MLFSPEYSPTVVLLVVVVAVQPVRVAVAADPPDNQVVVDTDDGQGRMDQVSFSRSIRPILADKCFQCHGPDPEAREADLRLDFRTSAVADRSGYAAIVPGAPNDSALVERVNAADISLRMPPAATKKTLTPKERQLLIRWIEQGAPYEDHWAFLPIVQTDPPGVAATDSLRNEIDAFILSKLNVAGLSLSPEADPAKLVRRVYIDLVGLLPPPHVVNRFVASPTDIAYEELVDDLLASPHYGERWGRHWLDQARYADSNGYTIDGDRTMWPYRDWVIKAINDDMSFDTFTIEQLAGDLLPDPTTAQLVATGFHRNTLINEEGGTDDEQFRNEEVIDRVNTTGAVWLGLTVGCAQCHTHKFDPITHEEFFRLFAFFNQTEDVNNVGPTVAVHENELLLSPLSPEQAAAMKAVEDDVRQLEATQDERRQAWENNLIRELSQPEITTAGTALQAALQLPGDKRTAEQQKLLAEEFNQQDSTLLEAQANLKTTLAAIGLGSTARSMIMHNLSEPRTTYRFIRGDFLRPDTEAGPLTPDIPAVLPPLNADDGTVDRLDLARWLVRSDQPLTPRVFVNRTWLRFFGQGLVVTENDFGTQGTFPTHPELLDWLAAKFVQDGWSRKALLRLIVTSATYRQSSDTRPDLTATDPLNQLLGRQNRLRFDAEIVRDAALTASGLLDRRIGGPSVRPPQPSGVYAFTQNNKNWVPDEGPDRYRRTMYTRFYRSAPHPMLTTFDSPDFQSVCTARARSNTPLQSLTMANDEGLIELARGAGLRVLRDIAGTERTDDRIRQLFLICYSRPPSETEITAVTDFYHRQREHFTISIEAAQEIAGDSLPESISVDDAAAWTAIARALMNTDEFITRE